MQTELWGQSCAKGAKSCLLTEVGSTPHGIPCRTEQQQLSHGEAAKLVCFLGLVQHRLA